MGGSIPRVKKRVLKESFHLCAIISSSRRRRMASVKAVRPSGLMGQVKEPAKAGDSAPKAPTSKQAPKKAEQKPREPKKRTKSSKPAAKN